MGRRGNEHGPGEVKLVKVRVTRCRKGAEGVPIGVRSIQGMKGGFDGVS